ncbi:hypothetical protein NWFMUON74_48370 [Nocardia wallacei]|uniref:Uncharacterized protein n=1 Tax=Nocardia wallacei TaxID=480035 RepID=A0A7G1KP43_9NOCA|nr:hypothetical protein NWFMUON74_48370 [Nocardia wallacei]
MRPDTRSFDETPIDTCRRRQPASNGISNTVSITRDQARWRRRRGERRLVPSGFGVVGLGCTAHIVPWHAGWSGMRRAGSRAAAAGRAVRGYTRGRPARRQPGERAPDRNTLAARGIPSNPSPSRP